MATAVLTPDQNAVIAEIFIAAPPARVFQAISDPDQIPRWWGQEGLYRVGKSIADVRPGGKWRSEGTGADGTSFFVEGEYLEVEPPKRLVHTWFGSFHPQKTVVRWELTPQTVSALHPSGPRKAGTGTLVRVTHEGFAGNLKSAQDHGEGWKRVLGWLEAYVTKPE
ncbi:MAG TPA: SRPBCC domain-containing protein [Dongiaceae bacterium]|nr:SRPBCC domain-containing protein [Dongiaceae bacterium]